MGAKKNRDKEILRYRRDKSRELVETYENLGISQKKVNALKAKENKYAAWVTNIELGIDY